MKTTDGDIAAITVTPGPQRGRRWLRVACTAAAMALPMTGLALPAMAATAASAGVHQAAQDASSSPLLPAVIPGPPGGNCHRHCPI